jgi:alpha,alpha-trehalase
MALPDYKAVIMEADAVLARGATGDEAEEFEDAVAQVAYWKSQGLGVAVVSSSGELVRALGAVGVTPARALVVAGSVSTVEAGVAGGFAAVVGVDRGGAGPSLRKAGATLVVRDLREIRAAAYCPPGHDCLASPASAIAHAAWLADRMRRHRLALFLDYDGTLTPIVRRPEDARITDSMRALVARLAGLCTVAVVSGRDRADAERMVGVDTLVYAGSHGYDIAGPGGLEHQHPEALDAVADLDAAETELGERLDGIRGARVERKRFAVAVHYREVSDEAAAGTLARHVDEVNAAHAALRKMSGKKVYELQPDVAWDKGRAVLWLRQTLGLDGHDAMTVYIGDDTTDEHAFLALRLGGAGAGIRVGNPDEATEALFVLRDCDEVEQFLSIVADRLR